MQLTGPQLKRLNRILAHAFPSYPELQRMVRFSLGVQLNTIVQSINVTQAVFELVDWADSHNKLTELIRGAQEENSDHVELCAFAIELRALYAPTPTNEHPATSLHSTLAERPAALAQPIAEQPTPAPTASADDDRATDEQQHQIRALLPRAGMTESELLRAVKMTALGELPRGRAAKVIERLTQRIQERGAEPPF